MPPSSVSPVIKVLRRGDAGSKPDPFTVVIVANPALEVPWQSGTFIADPVMAKQPAFDTCATYVVHALFGALPGQKEHFLGDPAFDPHVQVLSLFVAGLPAQDANALVAQDGVSNLLIARRSVFLPFLNRCLFGAGGVPAGTAYPDVVYAVSASESHDRDSAWFTSDDDARPGISYSLDGVQRCHRYYHLIPGTVALHASSSSLTALHEFGHALSSYSNGAVLDLYVDSSAGLNNKRGRPIPPDFATYDGTSVASDLLRDSLAYPGGWQSYHGELRDPAVPAVMDDYWVVPAGKVVEDCLHDRITGQFLKDRLLAKINR